MVTLDSARVCSHHTSERTLYPGCGKTILSARQVASQAARLKKAEEREEDTVAEGIVKTEAFPPTIPSACAQVNDETKVKRPVAGGFSPSFGKSFSVCDCIVFFLFLS
jgi:hypothetical protein